MEVVMKVRHNQISILVQVSGSPVYKATIVKEVLNGNTHVSFAERLRRVRGYSEHPGSSETEDNEDALDLDDALMLGDTLAVKLLYDKDSVALAFVKIITSMKSKSGGKYATLIPSINIGDFCFEGCILESHCRNVVYVKNVITSELCKSLDGASLCVVE